MLKSIKSNYLLVQQRAFLNNNLEKNEQAF